MQKGSFPVYLKSQLDELGRKVLSEYEKLHGLTGAASSKEDTALGGKESNLYEKGRWACKELVRQVSPRSAPSQYEGFEEGSPVKEGLGPKLAFASGMFDNLDIDDGYTFFAPKSSTLSAKDSAKDSVKDNISFSPKDSVNSKSAWRNGVSSQQSEHFTRILEVPEIVALPDPSAWRPMLEDEPPDVPEDESSRPRLSTELLLKKLASGSKLPEVRYNNERASRVLANTPEGPIRWRRSQSGETLQSARSVASSKASHEQIKKVGLTVGMPEHLPVDVTVSNASPGRTSTPVGGTRSRTSMFFSQASLADLSKKSISSGNGGIVSTTSGGAEVDSHCSSRWVILPGSGIYKLWCNFISLLVIISLFLTPLRFGFETSWSFDFVIRLWDYFFALDLLLTFNVGILTKRGLVLRRRTLFLWYIRTVRFWLDLVALIPFDTIWADNVDMSVQKNMNIERMLGMVRMLRVNRLLILFREMQRSTYFNLLGVVVGKFVIFILLCTHTCGCVFYALSSFADHNQDTWVHRLDPTLPLKDLVTRYVHVLFWAVATFKAGPTSGDLGPNSNSEMVLACLTMLLNICLQTYLVSNMAALLTTADTRIYAMRNQLRQVADFSQRHNLPHELRRQLRKWIKFKFASDQELDQNVLSGMPDLYRQRVSHVLFEEILQLVDIFSGCANIFLRQIHGRLKSTLYMPDQMLVNIDEPSGHLHIVGEGDVDMRDRSGSIISICSRGEAISALSFLCKVGQPFAVRTRTTCRILTLDHADWEAVTSAFPDNMHLVTQNLLTHCERKADEFMSGKSGNLIYTEMAQLVREHMVQLRETSLALFIAAAARGDTAELKKMLNSTSTNVTNYDARTALHLAAANGKVEAIQMLLDYDAEVDPVDNFGRTPLLEACRSNKPKAASVLFNAGATLGRDEFSDSAKEGNKDSIDQMAAGEMCTAASDVEQLWYLKMLLKYGADPNVGDYDMRTPLHVACACGNKPAVEYLVGFKGINLDPRDNFGRTPLMEAVRHGHEHVARILKARGAFHGFITDLRNMHPNAIPAGQELCQAAFANQIQYMHNLMAYCDLDVDAADYDLRTALMLACAEGNMGIAVHLVQCGADINRKDRWGHTALSEAQDHGHRELANVLVQLVKSGGKGVLDAHQS